MQTPREIIFADIGFERDRQDEKHGGVRHDDTHPVGDWVRFIHEHADKAAAAATLGHVNESRQHLIEVAALTVAALEMMERVDEHSEKAKSK